MSTTTTIRILIEINIEADEADDDDLERWIYDPAEDLAPPPPDR